MKEFGIGVIWGFWGGEKGKCRDKACLVCMHASSVHNVQSNCFYTFAKK